jgi:hypothetical protein
MVQVILVVRELGKQEPEYWMTFELPEVPAVGSYISINKLDVRRPFSEDLIVRHVWWQLHHSGTDAEAVGQLIDITVECDTALGPYATLDWQRRAERGRSQGVDVPDFEVARIPISRGEEDGE